MAVSLRMDPQLERELELAAKRRGVTKTQFIVDAVERALGRRNPYALLLEAKAAFPEARDESPAKAYSAARARSEIVRKLKAKHGVGGAR